MSKPAKDKQIIEGENGHKYFHMMLNMADDDLNAQEYRLLGHYLRWAGHGGTHEEGIRQTAKICHMSKTTVEKTRDELQTKGYLEVTKPTSEQAKKGEATRIKVLDRWGENIGRYAKLDTPPVTNMAHPPETCAISVTPPVSNQVHIEEHIEEPNPDRTKDKDLSPSGDNGNSTDRQRKTDLIKAWWDALPEMNRPVIKGNMYTFTGYLSAAGNALTKHLTPERMTAYVKSKTGEGGYWQDKILKFGKACEEAPAWAMVHYRPVASGGYHDTDEPVANPIEITPDILAELEAAKATVLEKVSAHERRPA